MMTKTKSKAKPKALNVDQVAERLGVHSRTIRRWVKQGRLPTPDTLRRRGMVWNRTTIDSFESRKYKVDVDVWRTKADMAEIKKWIEHAQQAWGATWDVAEAADLWLLEWQERYPDETPEGPLVDAVRKWRTYFRAEQPADSHQKGERGSRSYVSARETS
jgi:excisionase family DNA binding protein